MVLDDILVGPNSSFICIYTWSSIIFQFCFNSSFLYTYMYMIFDRSLLYYFRFHMCIWSLTVPLLGLNQFHIHDLWSCHYSVFNSKFCIYLWWFSALFQLYFHIYIYTMIVPLPCWFQFHINIYDLRSWLCLVYSSFTYKYDLCCAFAWF